jgi:hypothetical protein
VGNLREVEFYKDVRGRSDTSDELEKLSRSDTRAYGAILRRIDLLQKTELRQALQTKLIKQPTATIYVLRVQSGPVSFRLPFFESPCHNGKLVLLTHCEHRSLLRGDRYKALIQAAERRREDWIRRNCKEVRA